MPTATSKKRGATDDVHETKGRAAKAQKTVNGKKTTKSVMPAADFKEKALPLHIHVTHTPPAIDPKHDPAKEGEDETAAVTRINGPIDAGFISNLTLLPSSFSTGSYGWKGAKRIVVELQGSEVGEGGTREKVQVMLTINATVVGSKQAGKADNDEAEEADAASSEPGSETPATEEVEKE